MVYDPYGALNRGFLSGLDYISRFRQIQQEQDLAPLRKEILLLNLERARQETAERKALPGILERVYSSRYRSQVPSQDVGEMPGGAIPAEMSLAEIQRTMRGKETHEEVMGAIGPQEYATLQRVAPYALEGLRTREQQGERQREVERKQLGWNYLRAATDEMEAGRFRAAAHKLDLGLVQLGQAPKMVGLTDAIKTEEQEKRYDALAKRIGPAFRRTLEGDAEAAGLLAQESLSLPHDMQKGIGRAMREAASTVLGSKGDRKVQEGLRLYDSLLPKVKDPMKAMAEVRRQRPDLWTAMQKAKAIPEEAEVAQKLAGRRPSETTIKTMDTEAAQAAHDIGRAEELSRSQITALAGFLRSRLLASSLGAPLSAEKFHREIQAEIARLKGAPEEPLSGESAAVVEETWGQWFDRITGQGAAPTSPEAAPPGGFTPGRPERPGRGTSANPPPRVQTREAGMAELSRLMDLGLELEEAEALMRGAGWGRRATEPGTFIAP